MVLRPPAGSITFDCARDPITGKTVKSLVYLSDDMLELHFADGVMITLHSKAPIHCVLGRSKEEPRDE